MRRFASGLHERTSCHNSFRWSHNTEFTVADTFDFYCIFREKKKNTLFYLWSEAGKKLVGMESKQIFIWKRSKLPRNLEVSGRAIGKGLVGRAEGLGEEVCQETHKNVREKCQSIIFHLLGLTKSQDGTLAKYGENKQIINQKSS